LSDAPDHKVKRIVVEPGGILSLQRHKLRSEHWFVVSGKGTAFVDNKDCSVQNGSALIFLQKKLTAWRIHRPKI
jgi:mannose-6-phosphate isomerase-like protein (cupin superfamily)